MHVVQAACTELVESRLGIAPGRKRPLSWLTARQLAEGYRARKIMTSTFNPATDGGWRLSNGNTTATSPDNNTQQSIFAAYGSNPIPDHAKTYYDFTVSGAAIQTAFSVGLGQVGSNLANVNLKAEGKTVTNSTFIETTYNAR
jgi:hypothetical protein